MQTFTLKPEHVKLLNHANIDWHDMIFGAPTIDPKNPYGGGDAIEDITQILDLELFTCQHDEKHLSKEQAQYCQKLHNETGDALQVILAAMSFEPGLYEADDYQRNWRRVKE